MAIDTRAIVAGLAAGASGLGADINQRRAKALAFRQSQDAEQSASDRALKNLLAVEAAKAGDASIYDKAEPFTLPDGSTVMAERNKRTGQYRPVAIGDETTDTASPSDVAMGGLTGSRTPLLRRPGMSPPVPDVPLQEGEQVPQMPALPAPQETAPRKRVLAPYVKPTAARPHMVRNEQGIFVPVNDQGLGLDGKPVKGYTPPVQPQIVGGVDPTTGQPNFYRVEKGGGAATPIEGLSPKPGSSGSGGTGAQAPVDDMIQRFGEIQNHAKDLAAGRWQMTPAMQGREGLTYGIANASAGGHPQLKEPLIAGAMDALGVGGAGSMDFSRYQALMNSTRAFGDDAAKVFKGRQNEDAVKREIALSQLTPDDYNNPTVVQQKLDRMQHVIHLAQLTMPGGEGSAPKGAVRQNKAPTSEAAWAAVNPAKKGESFEAYHARYLASQGGH